ncbi:MAG: EamA family transporter [Neptuniibacter caesariensis]|uniref:EamA family transporter n=1 Tax=Neptuniibacter caesariensis TaxID=207954 RepID=A0A2G6JPH6_NEPCE|nr:MAG: EamA family transporter [Neptuniibacter caesariensis]
MNLNSGIRLVLLAAIWGASFLFMRISVPVIGAPAVADLRVLLAAVFLVCVAVLIKQKLEFKKHWKHYFLLGLFNSALPFLLFSYAALHLQASLLSILNATAPIWGCLIAVIALRQTVPLKTVFGLVLGVAGVVGILGFDVQVFQKGLLWPCLAAVGAAFCYGVASIYARYANSVEPFNNAHGSMWSSALILLPLVFAFAPRELAANDLLSVKLMGSLLTLGVVCTGVAYLMYFRLIEDVGPASALTVTFLVPVFGVLWGHLFLNEPIGWPVLVGGVSVVTGTMLVTNFSLRSLFQRKKAYV